MQPEFQFLKIVSDYWPLLIIAPSAVLLCVAFSVPIHCVFKAISITTLLLALVWSGLFWFFLDPLVVDSLTFNPSIETDSSGAAWGMLVIFLLVLWLGPLAILLVVYAIVTVLTFYMRKLSTAALLGEWSED